MSSSTGDEDTALSRAAIEWVPRDAPQPTMEQRIDFYETYRSLGGQAVKSMDQLVKDFRSPSLPSDVRAGA